MSLQLKEMDRNAVENGLKVSSEKRKSISCTLPEAGKENDLHDFNTQGVVRIA